MPIRIRRQHGAPDRPVAPPHAGAEQQGATLRSELEHTAERDLQNPRCERYGRTDQLGWRRARERLLPEVCHGFLLARRGAQLLLGARQGGVAARVVPPQESEPLGAHSRYCPFDKEVFEEEMPARRSGLRRPRVARLKLAHHGAAFHCALHTRPVPHIT
jgi:hypothetical protein